MYIRQILGFVSKKRWLTHFMLSNYAYLQRRGDEERSNGESSGQH